MARPVWHIGLILLVAGIVLGTNLGGARLWDRDEPRNAGCAAEMQARGDWVVPTFNDELRDAKPVLLYWLIMVAYSAFGVNEVSARLASVLLGLGTVLATYAIGRRLFNPRVALLAALVLATSLMFDVASRAATPDAPLIFCGTVAVMIYVLGTFAPRDSDSDPLAGPVLRHAGQYFPTRWSVVAAMYAVMGIGILAKGPVGLVMPTAILGMFLLIQRLPPAPEPAAVPTSWTGGLLQAIGTALRPFAPGHFFRTCWLMRPITAVTVALAIAAPWYVLVGIRTHGAFLRGFFLDEHFGRATTAMEHHSGGPWFYPLAILIGFFPWSVFAAPVVIGAVRRMRSDDPWKLGTVLMTCWIGVTVGAFTLARTKLPSYVTPCYPALALMTGVFLWHLAHGTMRASERWLPIALGIVVLIGVATLIGLPLAAAMFLPGEASLGAIGLIPLIGGGTSLYFLRKGKRQAVVVSHVVMATVLTTTIFAWVTARIDRHQQSHIVLNMVTEHSDNPTLGSYGSVEPSLVFYAGQPIRPVGIDTTSPVQDRSRKPRRATHPPLANPKLDLTTFLSQEDAFLITSGRYLEKLTPALPPGIEVLVEVPAFLKRDAIVLLGRKRETTYTADQP